MTNGYGKHAKRKLSLKKAPSKRKAGTKHLRKKKSAKRKTKKKS